MVVIEELSMTLNNHIVFFDAGHNFLCILGVVYTPLLLGIMFFESYPFIADD